MARVLLVDDDIAEISAVKRVLSREGHQTVLATSIADALALADQERPVVAIVAAACESGGGLELARRLLAEDAELRLPVLLLGEPGDDAFGAVAIPRPLDPATLAAELGIALGSVEPEPPVARLPLEALSGGSPQATTSAAQARATEVRRAAAEALQRRAEDLRRERAEPAGWLESPSRPPPPPEPEDRPGFEPSPPTAPPDVAAQRQADHELLVAEIDAELDRLTREASDRGTPPGSEGRWPEPLLPEDAADEIARRAEEEADRRRAEAEARAAAAGAETAQPAEPERIAEDLRRAEAGRLEAEQSHLLDVAEAERHAAVSRPLEPLAPPRHLASGAPAVDDVTGLPEPELADPPPELAAGTLAEAPMPRLLALAARGSLTGRIDFGTAAPRSVYFEDGRVVGATSGAPSERVEEVALRLGMLTREQHRQAVPAATGLSTRRAALRLLESGFLKPDELTPLVRRRTEEVLFALCGEVAGPFRYAAARVPAEERIALARPTLPLAVEGVRRRWMEPRLAPLLGDASTLLAPAPRAPSAAELGLSPAEVRLAALADGLRSLDEILAGSPLDPLATRQLLAALVTVGALVPRFQGGPARLPAARAIDLGRLREKLDQVRRADYFTILGLSRQCTPYEVREAAGRLLGEFDPLRFHGQREPGLGDEIEEVRRVVAEARHVLADQPLRAEYESGLG